MDPLPPKDGPDSFIDTVEMLYNGRLFIYDDERKLAWLYSMLDFMILLLRYDAQLKGRIDTIQFPSPRPANMQSHNQLRKVFLNLQLETIRVPGAGAKTYAQVIQDFLFRYNDLFSQLLPIVRTRWNDEIIGWELLQIIQLKASGRAVPRKLVMDQSIRAWAPLIGVENIIFTRGLDNLIRPKGSQDTRIVHMIPERKNILVCPVFLLKRLLEEDACEIENNYTRKSKAYAWYFKKTDSQIECLMHIAGTAHCWDHKCWVAYLQEVEPMTNFLQRRMVEQFRDRSARSTIEWNGNGAICFGRL